MNEVYAQFFSKEAAPARAAYQVIHILTGIVIEIVIFIELSLPLVLSLFLSLSLPIPPNLSTPGSRASKGRQGGD